MIEFLVAVRVVNVAPLLGTEPIASGFAKVSQRNMILLFIRVFEKRNETRSVVVCFRLDAGKLSQRWKEAQ